MRLNNIKISLAIVTLILSLQSTLFAQVSNPRGEIQSVPDDDIWAKTLEGNHYNELWNYQFYLNDDITIHISFSVANFGSFKSPVSGVQMSIYNLTDDVYQVSREYPIHYLVQDREEYMFQLRDERRIYFRGKLPDEHEVRVGFSKDGNSHDVELKLKNIHRGLKWGDGIFHIGDERVGIITHIPYAEVEGTVKVNDIEKKVYGRAYMDHTYQDQATTDLVVGGYRFVHMDDEENWDHLYFLLPDYSDQNPAIGYRLTKTDGLLTVKGVEYIDRITEGDAFGVEIARILDLKLESSSDIRLSRTKDLEKFSVLGELGWLAKKAAKSFLGGEVIYIRGEGILMESGKKIQGKNFLHQIMIRTYHTLF